MVSWEGWWVLCLKVFIYVTWYNYFWVYPPKYKQGFSDDSVLGLDIADRYDGFSPCVLVYLVDIMMLDSSATPERLMLDDISSIFIHHW